MKCNTCRIQRTDEKRVHNLKRKPKGKGQFGVTKHRWKEILKRLLNQRVCGCELNGVSSEW
jgi:hypothetical protein